MSRHISLIGFGALCLLAFCGFSELGLLIPVAHAAPVFPAGTEETIADMAGKAILVLNLLTWIVFVMLNFLLDPQFIFGNGGNLMTILNEIWQLARDLMNVIFAVMLIGAAIYTIVTSKKEFLSQYGPKFITAVILVNFSWFLPRVAIDIANVGASAVYGIPSYLNNNPAAQCRVSRTHPPMQVPAGCTAVPTDATRSLCPCMAVTDAQFFLSERDAGWYAASGYKCALRTMLCYREEALNLNTLAPHSAVLNGLVVNHARLGILATVPTRPPGVGGGETSRMISDLVRVMIVLLIHVALVFPLLAMMVAFFIRIPVLWITMAFMPFYFLDFLLGGQLEQFTQGYGKKILTTFIKAAFLPLLVAVPFSIGFLMLNAGSQLTGGSLAGIPIRIFDQINNFWQLLWLFMSLGVIWVGVFAVLKGDDILSTGAQSIKGFGETLGKIALKAPLAAPILPGSSLSIAGALRMPHDVHSLISSGRVPDKAAFDRLLHPGATTPTPDATKAVERIRKDGTERDMRNAANELHKAAEAGGLNAKLLQDISNRLSKASGMTITSDNIETRLEDLRRAGLTLGMDEAQFNRLRDRVLQFRKDQADAKAKEEKKK